jgi:hypothetical protein
MAMRRAFRNRCQPRFTQWTLAPRSSLAVAGAIRDLTQPLKPASDPVRVSGLTQTEAAGLIHWLRSEGHTEAQSNLVAGEGYTVHFSRALSFHDAISLQ